MPILVSNLRASASSCLQSNYGLNLNLQISYFVRITHGSLSLNRSIHLYASVTTLVYSTSSTSLLALALSPQYHIYLTLIGISGMFPLLSLLLIALGDTRAC